jgi:hypothetical protein
MFKILTFKKGCRLKNERWTMNDQPVEVVHEINGFRVALNNTGGWNKQKSRLRAKNSQTL